MIEGIKQLIQKGDSFMAKLVSEDRDYTTILEKFEKNSNFLINL